MKIQIVKEKRRSMVLKVDSSDLAILKAPKSMPDKRIEQFLSSKAAWLDKIAKKLELQQQFANSFDVQNKLYFLGQPYMDKSQLFDTKVSQRTQDRLVKKFYLDHFYLLQEMVQNISKQTGLAYAQVVPTSSVRVWGSFSKDKLMKLNFKLLFVPKELAEYVIIHELCHGAFMNHSPQFWKKVQAICPNYKVLKAQLNAYGFVLKTQL